MTTETDDRFWSKVDQTGRCWLWKAGKVGGYGRFYFKGKAVLAHRFAYEKTYGKIPKGLEIDHLCRNVACVKYLHLEAVTHKVNVLRGIGEAARHAKKTHCPQGHSYSGRNLLVEKHGYRRCRSCASAQDASAYLRKKARGEI